MDIDKEYLCGHSSSSSRHLGENILLFESLKTFDFSASIKFSLILRPILSPVKGNSQISAQKCLIKRTIKPADTPSKVTTAVREHVGR